jgi:uncharacterized membrane protein
MDKIVEKIVALGVPGIVLFVAITASGWAGAAAITAALAFLGGPFGMLGGIAMLGIVSLISKGISEYGAEAILQEIVKKFKENGKSKDDIEKEINNYPISRELKLKIKDYLSNFD